jgi:predicted RNA binding protein YcfA (HicA-like mRNA interferase family)
MKVPRNVEANDLINLLKRYGYDVIRQTGSHIRLSKKFDEGEHDITVPNHKPIKIGTLQNIVKDICFVNNLDINEFYRQF